MSLDLERERTIQLLCRQFALDYLTTQDLEARLEKVYRATSAEELQALVAGLPAASPPAEREPRYPIAAMRDSGSRRVSAIFGTVRKRGDWEPAQQMTAQAWFAELELDFRDALIHEGVTTIRIEAGFSHVKIIVPPGLHIECDGSAYLGEFSERLSMSAPPDSGAPTLRITGSIVCGQVDVRMRLPDETAMDAFRRERKRPV